MFYPREPISRIECTANSFSRALCFLLKSGWGGNYFVVGGAVKGGQVLGSYPNDLTENSLFIIEKGRVLPTVPWDAIWAGVAEWMGLKEDRIKEVLPNLSNFDRDKLLSSELFVE